MNKIKLIIMSIVFVGAAIGFYFYWQNETIYPNTEDSYLQANILSIAPQIAGEVKEVQVTENQLVKEGDVLFTIVDDTLRAQVEEAKAQLVLAQKGIGVQGDTIQKAQAQVRAAQSALDNANEQYARTNKLFKLGDVAQAKLDEVTTQRDSAKSALVAAQTDLASSQKNLGQDNGKFAKIELAQASLDIAQIRLSHTVVKAPQTGWIANLTLRKGQIVAQGQSLFSLVEDGEWWISANFKETDIYRIRPGQSAKINIDMYPGVSLEGTVESLGAGAGAVFSLIPAQNTTGNWVKVTRRFPVRIALNAKKKPGDIFQLRAGASATATIDTSSFDVKAK